MWNWDFIRKKLTDYSCFGLLRSQLTSKKRNICDIVEKWPFLFEMAGMMNHMTELTGQDIPKAFESFRSLDLEGLLQFLTIQSNKRLANLKIQRDAANSSCPYAMLLSAVLMLTKHFDEELLDIIRCIEETTLPHEVLDVDPQLPSTPCILALGTSPFVAKKFFLTMEKVVVCTSLSNSFEALLCLCAAFFIFGILYPPKASATLTYVERVMAELEDSSGLLKASTNAGQVARSAVTKLQQLIDNQEAFEKEMNGDD